MGNTIEHLDSLFTVHVAPYTSQVASLQLLRRYTCATNDHRLHPCYVPSQSQARHPFAYGLSTRPHSVSESPKPRLPALCFTQNPNPTFPPNIFTLRPQSHRQDDPAECNGVGEDHVQYSATPVGLLTTISGKSRLAASRSGCV